MADLIYMMNTLLDKDGNILVEGLMDPVAKVTDEELASYDGIDFDVDDYKNDLKTAKLVNDKDKVSRGADKKVYRVYHFSLGHEPWAWFAY